MTDIKQMLASNLNDLGEIHLSAKDSAVLLTIVYDLICVERLYERIKELESENNRLRSAALEVVSWDWRALRRRPNHIDWMAAPHAVDNLEKALEGE